MAAFATCEGALFYERGSSWRAYFCLISTRNAMLA
jgi:hypothetical protein